MKEDIRFSTIKLFHNSTNVPFFLGFSFENVFKSVKNLQGNF
jgi:hypothetical protein